MRRQGLQSAEQERDLIWAEMFSASRIPPWKTRLLALFSKRIAGA